MYYEEKIVDGIIYYRTNPNGKFIQKTLESITSCLLQLRTEYNRLSKQYRLFENRLIAINRAATDFTINYDDNGEIEKE